MKQYHIIKESNVWSATELSKKVEGILNQKAQEGYQIISVSLGMNAWRVPTAYITICK
jgi:hypothetical protein